MKKNRTDDIMSLMGGIGAIVGIFVLIAIVILAFGSFYSVSAGSVGVKFIKFGDNKGFEPGELPQGFGFKMPIKDVVWDIPFRTQTINFCNPEENEDKNCDYAKLTPKDKNGIDFGVDITIRYRLDPTQASEFLEQKGKGVSSMEQLIVTAARADSTRGVFGQYPQEEVPENRIAIAQEIREVLQARLDQEASGKLKPGFFVVEAVDARNVRYNPEIEARIIQKQTRLQEAQEMEYKLEIADKERDIQIINADRDKQATILRAEGEGESVLIVATAKAEGIDKVNTAYQDMPWQYVMTKYAEAIQDTDKVYMGFESLGGNMLPIMDMNEIMGTLKTAGKIQDYDIME